MSSGASTFRAPASTARDRLRPCLRHTHNAFIGLRTPASLIIITESPSRLRLEILTLSSGCAEHLLDELYKRQCSAHDNSWSNSVPAFRSETVGCVFHCVALVAPFTSSCRLIRSRRNKGLERFGPRARQYSRLFRASINLPADASNAVSNSF